MGVARRKPREPDEPERPGLRLGRLRPGRALRVAVPDQGRLLAARHAAVGERGQGLERRADERARPEALRDRGRPPLRRQLEGADGRGTPGRPQLARVERAEQPDLPEAAVQEDARRRWQIESAKDYAKMCNAIVDAVHLVTVGAVEGRLRRHRAARQQQPELAARLRLAARVPARDEGRRRDAASTPTRTTRTTAGRPRRPRTPPPPGIHGNAPTAVTLGNFSLLVPRGHEALREQADLDHRVRLPDESARPALRRHLRQAGALPQAGVRDRARRTRRIDMFLWFLLRDEQRYDGWQSGLMTFGGAKKPSYNAFAKLRGYRPSGRSASGPSSYHGREPEHDRQPGGRRRAAALGRPQAARRRYPPGRHPT